ncbi:TolC family protein [Gemmata sp. G18]|uniref:TolC family protein n=1 Tax=Gemmata palustris TaxID=2822762 RepID=A0ABS5BQ47_9BACT|nr:TolC family protein [Gemmata palustris]MBP3955855.1 TolC family protein [Gemmata palustris]
MTALRTVLFAVTGCGLIGCSTPKGADRSRVSAAVEARFGQPVGLNGPNTEQLIVPERLGRGEPLTEEQAVVLALWNNAAFHEQLVELDLTRADLVQAGLLPNPEFVYYWPAGNKPFKYLIDFPIESLWLRPLRMKATAAENERASARLTQLALDLIRDTRQAYADLQLARDRVRVSERAVQLREDILKLAEARLKAGDASELEASTARIDALQARQDLTRTGYEIPVARERLRNLTGLSAVTVELVPDDAVFDPHVETPLDELVADAVATRPDAAAADHAARAAVERLRVARLGWVRFLGLLDATSGRVTGHEFSPALRMTVPIFNRNQGGIARAQAELDQLERRKVTVHNQIVQDVRTAHARYQQARAELDLLKNKTRPEVEATIKRARAAFEKGGVTYLLVLETNRQLIDTYAREAQLFADLRRAWAELERSVGRKLSPPGRDSVGSDKPSP